MCAKNRVLRVTSTFRKLTLRTAAAEDALDAAQAARAQRVLRHRAASPVESEQCLLRMLRLSRRRSSPSLLTCCRRACCCGRRHERLLRRPPKLRFLFKICFRNWWRVDGRPNVRGLASSRKEGTFVLSRRDLLLSSTVVLAGCAAGPLGVPANWSLWASTSSRPVFRSHRRATSPR